MTLDICVMIATFNEVDNVEPLYEEIKSEVRPLQDKVSLSFLFIDNKSDDGTRDVLRKMSKNKDVMCIFNSANYGTNRSAFHGMVSAPGKAVIMMCADFQDPPNVVPKLICSWLDGQKVTMAKKLNRADGLLVGMLRSCYYMLLSKSNPMYKKISGCTGFGIYDRTVIDKLASLKDPFPFFRGMIAEVQSDIGYVPYNRAERKHGTSSMGFLKMWDEGVIGLINNSKAAIRLISLTGVITAVVSFIGFLTFIILKIFNWDLYPIGIIPIFLLQLIALGTLMFCLGVIGEYIGAIYTQVLNRPIVFEEERINI